MCDYVMDYVMDYAMDYVMNYVMNYVMDYMMDYVMDYAMAPWVKEGLTEIELLLGRPTAEGCVLVHGIQYLLLHLTDAVTVEHLHSVSLSLLGEAVHVHNIQSLGKNK